MKKLLFIIVTLLMSACGAYQTTSGGKEDVGYISLIGDPAKYKAGVLVSIDNGKEVIVEVVEEGKLSRTDSRLKVPTGKHDVRMTYQGKVIYEQNIIVFVQETKKIALP